ncbi:MAG: hypothetical protein L3J46_10575, partial [Kangiellaceae bacterium]|nr:hypothetical protein [Kangiellaceae bacterium]
VRFLHHSDEFYFGASDVMPEVMELYEVEGLTGFWQFSGVEFSDLETAVNFASMIRFVPANGRYPNTFGYWELGIVVRSDRFSLMARMNVEPMLLINAGLVRDFGKTPK